VNSRIEKQGIIVTIKKTIVESSSLLKKVILGPLVFFLSLSGMANNNPNSRVPIDLFNNQGEVAPGPDHTINTCTGDWVDRSFVIAVDISGSVDDNEFTIQLSSYAEALMDHQVQDNLLQCGCTELAVVMWSDGQRVVYPKGGEAPFQQMGTAKEILDLAQFFESVSENRYLNDRLGLTTSTNVFGGLEFSINFLLEKKNKNSLQTSVLLVGDGEQNYKQYRPASGSLAEDFAVLHERAKAAQLHVHSLPIVISDPSMMGGDFVEASNPRPFPSPLAPKKPFVPNPNRVVEFYEQFVKSEHGFHFKAEGTEEFAQALTTMLRNTTACVAM
jgi:hypothetical protein